MASQTTTSTILGDEGVCESAAVNLDLKALPPIFVLSTHMDVGELHRLEEWITRGRGPLTYDPHEATIFIGKITQKRRAVLELRARGVWSTEVAIFSDDYDDEELSETQAGPSRKKQRRAESCEIVQTTVQRANGDDSSTDSEPETETKSNVLSVASKPDKSVASPLTSREKKFNVSPNDGTFSLVKLAWVEDSKDAGMLLPLPKYIIYRGKRIAKLEKVSKQEKFVPISMTITPETRTAAVETNPGKPNIAHEILERARAELEPSQQNNPPRSFASTSQLARRAQDHSQGRIAHLIHQSTSEHDLGQSSDLPEMPDWVKRRSNYSCERSTPIDGPNDAFVTELKKIRLARTLTTDEIGVRAYSTSIAAIAAYPYTITDQREILALPGCETKIAALWVEWKNKDGFIQAAHDAETDEHLQVLRLFYDIWGVGAHTAREFYNRGWRDLDDVVEFGWKELSRVQQIGVKYYDEFLDKLSRTEVEFIGRKIHEHAQRVREPTGVRTCIVGGYRRGKTESGDVDIIVSHLDESATLNIVGDIVKSLIDEGWITHELTTSFSGSRRSQATHPYRAEGGGHGFDTLDKALVVWQDPNWPDKEAGGKNPNVHRRVDIIISPWSKVGCGILGWTAGMTFERDLRRYVKRFKGWKFDSSGVRDRATGEEVDLEGVGGRCTTCDEAERKVFAGIGLEYREPWERCTG